MTIDELSDFELRAFSSARCLAPLDSPRSPAYHRVSFSIDRWRAGGDLLFRSINYEERGCRSFPPSSFRRRVTVGLFGLFFIHVDCGFEASKFVIFFFFSIKFVPSVDSVPRYNDKEVDKRNLEQIRLNFCSIAYSQVWM